MFPVLFKIGPITLYTYGLMIATGFLVAILLMMRQAAKEGESPELLMDMAFYAIIAAIVGSRVLYVIVNYQVYLANPINAFKLWEGGLVFYGGFIGAALTGFWYVKKHNLEPWKIADIAAPSIALGHSIGRWGCVAAGCCWGRPTDSWVGIIFTNPLAMAPNDIALYPTQLFSSLNELIIFFILIAVRPYKKFQGQLFLMWMMLYSVGRFIIEFFRGDPRGYIIPDTASTSQGIAVFTFAFSAFLIFKFYRKAR